MPEHGGSSDRRRTPATWAARATMAAIAAGLAIVAIGDTLANVAAKADPASAHRLAPLDGVITAKLASSSFELKPQGSADSEPARLARLALIQDPTAVEALSILGLQAQMRDDAGQAGRIFSYANSLSRRELRPQLWAIEQAVGRGDIDSALAQYDVALRTSRQAEELLFPILAGAISEPLVRSSLRNTMARRPAWGEAFINFAAHANVDPQAAAQFFVESEKYGLPVGVDHRAAVVDSLVARDMVDDAWAYFRTYNPDAERQRLRDPNFLGTTAPSVFDWVVLQNDGISATIQQSTQGGSLDFSAPSAVGGAVARQMLMLPPGSYRLEGQATALEQPDATRPYWELVCSTGRRIVRVDVSGTDSGDINISGRFAIPSDCPVQTLSLIVRASNEIAGVSGRIDRLELVSIKGPGA